MFGSICVSGTRSRNFNHARNGVDLDSHGCSAGSLPPSRLFYCSLFTRVAQSLHMQRRIPPPVFMRWTSNEVHKCIIPCLARNSSMSRATAKALFPLKKKLRCVHVLGACHAMPLNGDRASNRGNGDAVPARMQSAPAELRKIFNFGDGAECGCSPSHRGLI